MSGLGGRPGDSGLGFLGYGLIVSLGLAVFVAPFACPWPDGLERVAKMIGFDHRAASPLLPSPLSDYRLPFVGSAAAATALAGAVGSLVAFVAAWILAWRLTPALAPRKEAHVERARE